VTYVIQEVIEFPVLKVGAKTFEIQSTFHQYVQPKVYRQLTPFCIQVCHYGYTYSQKCIPFLSANAERDSVGYGIQTDAKLGH